MWWMWCYPILCTIALVSSSSSWPYHQIYPTVNETDGRSPLYFAVVLSFGGNSYKSIGALPGIQIALDYINSEPSILPGYSLHYTLTDSQVRTCKSKSCYFIVILKGLYTVWLYQFNVVSL